MRIIRAELGQASIFLYKNTKNPDCSRSSRGPVCWRRRLWRLYSEIGEHP